jgi:S-formylglutathione hydrolase FrmB
MPLKRKALAFITVSSIVILAVVWSLMRHRPAAEPATIDHPRLVPGVIMQDVTFFSQALQRNMQYRVLLREDTAGKKLPVVYLLHGGGGTFRDWSNYSNVAQFAARGFVLVMPQGDYSYYTNSSVHPKDRYEDYVVDDLPADVERRFPVRTDRSGHAIAGVSMGGFGAVKVALRNPWRYAFAGALSAAIDVPRRRFSWRRLNQSRAYWEIFGPDGSVTRGANDPFFLVAAADPKAVPYFYLTCGHQEGLLAPNREFAALLERYGLAHEFHDVPGGHDWNQWNAQLPGLFESLRSQMHLSP